MSMQVFEQAGLIGPQGPAGADGAPGGTGVASFIVVDTFASFQTAVTTTLGTLPGSTLITTGPIMTAAVDQVINFPSGHDLLMYNYLKVRGPLGALVFDDPDSTYGISVNGNDQAVEPVRFGGLPNFSDGAWVQGQGSKCLVRWLRVTQVGAGRVANISNIQNSAFQYIGCWNNNNAVEGIVWNNGSKNCWVDNCHSSVFNSVAAMRFTTELGNQQTSKIIIAKGMSEGGYILVEDAEDVLIQDYALNGGSQPRAVHLVAGGNRDTNNDGTGNGAHSPSSLSLVRNQYKGWTVAVECTTTTEVQMSGGTGAVTNLIKNSAPGARFYLGRDFGGGFWSGARYVDNAGGAAPEATCVKAITYA